MTQALILPPWIPTTGCLKIVANNPTKPSPPFVCNYKIVILLSLIDHLINYVYLLFNRHPCNLCHDAQFALLFNEAGILSSVLCQQWTRSVIPAPFANTSKLINKLILLTPSF